MAPFTSLLKQLSSILKAGATEDDASGKPFARWDRSHFDRWTQPPAAGTGAPPRQQRRQSAFERWTRAPAKDAVSGQRRAVRGKLQRKADQARDLFFR